jgi:hypothetical protein
MAIPLAIDTKGLLEQFPFLEEEVLGRVEGGRERFQIHRVCAYATVAHDASTFRHLSRAIRAEPVRQVQQAALDWQADQEDELDEVEVFHHLKQMDAMSWSIAGASLASDRTAGMTTTLLASAQSPTFAARARGRPPSSFRQYSLRTTIFWTYSEEACGPYFRINHTDMSTIQYNRLFWFRHPIVWANDRRNELLVFWHLQVDFVDLLSRTPHPAWRPVKRRRTMNQFLQVAKSGGEDSDITSRVNHAPEAKRFKGIRFRDERNRWIAEMKPPRSKNKVSFGDFKSQTEAARAVDAAFFYYGKTEQHLNFADTPQILSMRPAPAGLSEKEKLKFVKEQAKWVASMASALPSTPTSPSDSEASANPSDIIREPSRDLSGAAHTWKIFSPLRFPEADNGVSRSSVHIMSDERNRPESSPGAVTNLVNSSRVELPCELQEMGLEFLVLSPPVPVFQTASPRDLQGDIAYQLLEQQSSGCEGL